MATEIVLAADFKTRTTLLNFGSRPSDLARPNDFKTRGEERSDPGDDQLTARLVLKVLVAHQRHASWWQGHEAHEFLRAKAAELIKHFGLHTHRGIRLPIPLFCIDSKLKFKTIGSYNPEANGYALAGTISFNLNRLPMDDCLLLAYLLKFLVCYQSHFDGGSGEFDGRAKEAMKGHGIKFDSKGNVVVDPLKGFADFLREHGISAPNGSVIVPRQDRGKSTLKRWECHCQGCQVGTAQFFAICPNCDQPFRIGKHIQPKPRSKEIAIREV